MRGVSPRRILRAWTAALAICLLSPAPAPAQETGNVVEVVDGDTLRVRAGGETRTVRLIGIDAPERSHPSRMVEFLADEAAAFLSSLCEGKTVTLEPGDEDVDRHGRLLRYVFLPPPDGRLVNLEMVRQGYARAYRRFAFSRKAAFLDAEREARAQDKGIWREKGMAEVRWILSRRIPSVEVLPLPGDRYAVLYGGMVKTGVPPGKLAATIRDVLRWRAGYSDRDFREAAEKAGFLPIPGGGKSSDAGPPAAPPPPAPSRAPAPEVVSWEEAGRAIGREVVVEGTLVRTHRAKTVLYLNFHPNWKKYVSVVIHGGDLARFPKDPERFYRGKTVRVRGTVTLYEGRPELVVRSPEAITIVK
jgi:endonuclease YncB( thermonuclease family)